MISQENDGTGLTRHQLKQLCQPAHIEHTFHLLFHLNHWAKASERLFFVDRQGLYRVKAALLQQAYTARVITATAYIDGRRDFGKDLALDVAANLATETLMERLADLTYPLVGGDALDQYDRMACQLYTRATGKSLITSTDVLDFDVQPIHAYIHARLQELERKARIVRQPIPLRELAALCVAPTDLLDIQGNRFYTLN